MKYWKMGIPGIAWVITTLMQAPVQAEEIEVSGRGGGVYDTATGAYSAFTLLEPYGITTSTDLNGYYIFDEIYVGDYELTASLQGYADTQVNVTVQDGISPYDVTLTAQ